MVNVWLRTRLYSSGKKSKAFSYSLTLVQFTLLALIFDNVIKLCSNSLNWIYNNAIRSVIRERYFPGASLCQLQYKCHFIILWLSHNHQPIVMMQYGCTVTNAICIWDYVTTMLMNSTSVKAFIDFLPETNTKKDLDNATTEVIKNWRNVHLGLVVPLYLA